MSLSLEVTFPSFLFYCWELSDHIHLVGQSLMPLGYSRLSPSPGIQGHPGGGHSSFLVEMFGRNHEMAGGTCISGYKTHHKHVFSKWDIETLLKYGPFSCSFLICSSCLMGGGVTSIVTCTPCVTTKCVKRVLLHCYCCLHKWGNTQYSLFGVLNLTRV